MNQDEIKVLLHGIRWSKEVQDKVIKHLADQPPKMVLVGIMDAIFKIEASLANYGKQAGKIYLTHAFDDLCRLLQADDDVIDVEEG